jgi:CO/xanthine dehydrogenase FAD-binding subunit
MKPAPFSYHAPASVDEAVALLGDLGDRAAYSRAGRPRSR